MSNEVKRQVKQLRKKLKQQRACSRNKKHGGAYTRPLHLDDFDKKEGAE